MCTLPLERSDSLKRRAHKLAGKGEYRKAALALRERAAIVEDAASWVMAGAMLVKARREDEAIAAFRQGMWLHERTGFLERARSVERVLEKLGCEVTASLGKRMARRSRAA